MPRQDVNEERVIPIPIHSFSVPFRLLNFVSDVSIFQHPMLDWIVRLENIVTPWDPSAIDELRMLVEVVEDLEAAVLVLLVLVVFVEEEALDVVSFVRFVDS